LDEAEALGRTVARHAFASDYFEPAVSPGALLAGMHIAAIQTNCERQVGPRQRVPFGLAALDEHRLFGTELVLEALG